MKRNYHYIKKLLVVGFSFVVIGISVFFIQNMSIDDKVNAATIVPVNIDPNTRPYDYDELYNAHWINGATKKGDSASDLDVKDTFYLGEWAGQPLEWRLLWDYGDGTGLASTAAFIKKADGTEEGIKWTDIDTFLYGDNELSSKKQTGGLNNGFTKQWWQTISKTQGKMGVQVAKKNSIFPIPFILSGFNGPAQVKGSDPGNWVVENTGHIGFPELKAVESSLAVMKISFGEGYMWLRGNRTGIVMQYRVYGGSRESPGDFLNDQLGIAPLIYINLPELVELSYSPVISSFQEGKGSTAKNTKVGSFKTSGGETPYSAISLVTSGTTNATDVDETGALVGAGLPLSNAFTLTNVDTTNYTADLTIGNASLTKGEYYVKARVLDKNSEVSEVVIKVDVLPADITGTLTPSQSTPYPYGTLNTTDAIGALSAVDSNGDVTSLTTFEFVHSDGSLYNDAEDGSLSLSGKNVTVKSASSLGAGTHTYTMRATKDAKSSDFSFSIVIDKLPLTITTEIGGAAYSSSTPLTSVINASNYGISSFSSDITLPYGEALETSSYPATYLYKNVSTGITTVTPETTVGSYTLEVSFSNPAVDLVNNYTVTYNNSYLDITADSLSSIVFNQSKTPLVYGDTETSSGGKVGDFTLSTTGGTTTGITYQFVDSASDTAGASASSSKDELEIVNNEIKVKAGQKLSAKSYSYFVLVTTTSGIAHVEPISFSVAKRPVSIQTTIGGANTQTIEVLDAIPTNVSYTITAGSFIDTLNASYQYYQANTTTVITNPNNTAGTYDLEATFSDEVNYDITKTRAILTVSDNFIKTFTFSGDTSTHEYGDIETNSNGLVGTLAITTDTGNDQAGARYQFASNATGTGVMSSDGLLTINTDTITDISTISISAGKKLNVGSYSYELLATTPKGFTKVITVSFDVTKRPVTVQTSLDGNIGITNIDVNDSLPVLKTSAVEAGSKNFLPSDNVTAQSYQYLKNGTAVIESSVNKSAGTYDLDVTYSDEANYDITKKKAQLQVTGNAITQVDYAGQTTFIYGDAPTNAGNVLGSLAIQTTTGNDIASPIFALCDDTTGANPKPSIGNFMISGNNIMTTGRLDVGSYNLYVKATSKIQGLESNIETITITVNQKDIHVTIKNPTSLNKKVGEDITKRTIVSADYDVKTLESGDVLTGTPVYQYDASFHDMSIGAVGIKIAGLRDLNPKNNYNIIYDVANIVVTQDNVGAGDYLIAGTPGKNNWYTSDVSITLQKNGYDEFISNIPPIQSWGSPIILTSNGVTNQYIQLRNSSTGAITTSTSETINIDKQVPDFTLTATVGGSAYISDQPTSGPIQVDLSQANANASGVTYYYTTNASDAAATEPVSSPLLWTSLGSNIDRKTFSVPERNTYYFKAVSGAGLVSSNAQSIGIYNNSTVPNPSTLKWANVSQYDLRYGESKSLAVTGDTIANNPITYSFKDSQGNAIDASVSSCLNIDTNSMLTATSGVCGVSDIVVYAQVGNYTTPLQKVITVDKALLSIQALYQSGTGYAQSTTILTNDLEPNKKVELASGSNLVGDEILMGVNDLGSYQYTYSLNGMPTSSVDVSQTGIYTLIPSFANALPGINDKYDITWNTATLHINDSDIDANNLYELRGGVKGNHDYYIQKPVTIHPKHPDFKFMSVDSGSPSTSDQDFTTEGINTVSLVFTDGLNHTISKTQIIKIDTLKPKLSIQASSGLNAVYLSNVYTEEDIHINSIDQPIGAINPSGASYYYTTDVNLSSGSPLDGAGNVKPGWTEVSGSFDIHTKATYYFKAVSGAGLDGDVVEFIANINKPDYTQKPTVATTSGGRYYAADGSWAKDDVIFTLSGSVTGYEVCTATVEAPCTSWNDILDQSAGTHTISGDVQNQYYYFRIKSTSKPYAETNSYKVSLDKGKPAKPTIDVQTVNTGNVARFINALSFGTWMNEAQEVVMNSSDSLSGLKEIRYDVHTQSGSIVQQNVLYSTAIIYQDAAYIITAKAYDNAGNVSELSAEQAVFIDLTDPDVEGVHDGESYYLPYAFVHYSDSASGIDITSTNQNNGSTTSVLNNDTLFTGKGNVTIQVSDLAGNMKNLSFRIEGLPDMSTWTCSEDHEDIIAKVQSQYNQLKADMAKQKLTLSDVQIQEIEAWLKDATGTCEISEPENNVSVESDKDRIPENTVLVVDVVTTKIKPESINLEDDEEVKMAYEVYFNKNGTILKSLNDSTLTVRLPMGAFKGANGLRLVEVNDDGTVKEIVFVVEADKAVFKTKTLKKYAFIAEKSKINIDTDKDNKPDINIDINKDGEGSTPDGKADINIDVNGDNIPDVNIDTDGDGKPDYNIDIDHDGEPDVNIGPVEKPWKPTLCQTVNGVSYCTSTMRKPYLNIDTDKDGRPDVNVDLDKDGIPDINIDIDDDLIPDIDIDSNGGSAGSPPDGIGDINVDTNGDGKADKNILKLTTWIPDKNVDGKINYDTMSGLISSPEEDNTPSPTPDSNDKPGSVLGSYDKTPSTDNVGGASTGDSTTLMVSWMLVLCSCTFTVLLHLVKRYRKSH